jgi:PAS domain S-box-containing protein
MVNLSDILGAKILIVDDLEANVRLLDRMLHGADYTCVASTMDPYEVCELHRNNRYDLILLDLEMSGMDGFQVMEGLKEIETDGYLPILVITAQPAHKLRALQAGAKDFISKPFDLVEVKTRIHNMLEVRLLYKKLEDYNKVLEQTVLERTAELRESEARYRSLTELASDWYWEQDESLRFTRVSGPVLEMLGIQGDAVAGATKEVQGEVQRAGWNEAERAILKAKMAARQPFLDFVYSRINPDGSHQYFQVSGEPKFDLSGRFTGYRGIGMEVTARMRPDRAAS